MLLSWCYVPPRLLRSYMEIIQLVTKTGSQTVKTYNAWYLYESVDRVTGQTKIVFCKSLVLCYTYQSY